MIKIFLWIIALLLLITVSFVIYNGGDSLEISIDEFNQSVTLSPGLSNLTLEERSAAEVILSPEDSSSKELIISSISTDVRTDDVFVFVKDGNYSVLIVVRNGSPYAYSINSTPLERCVSDFDERYC